MDLKLNKPLNNLAFFRYLFFILLIVVPFISNWETELNSLFILNAVFLGVGFSIYPKWVLFFLSSINVLLRIIISEEYHSLTGIIVRTLIYLLIAYISYAITNQFTEINNSKTEVILALSKSLDSRDTYTGNHSENVANYALMIAKEINFSKEQCEAIFVGGLLHDIGKIGIPESILTKTSKLTDDEFENIRQHPTIGFNMIKHISSLSESGILDMVLYHHERYDGQGYPMRLKGEEIPLTARIMAIADSFDAITTKRSYKSEMNLDFAIKEIKNNKGTQFDPDITEIFLRILERERKGIFIKSRGNAVKAVI